MSDNPLKATVEAIAESDNERGGVLITRLREAHLHGREDGALPGGGDTLTSPVDVFTAGMIGQELDVVVNPAGSTGNEGRYRILAVPAPTTAQLRMLGGGVPSFAAEDPVIWRFGTLRVEAVYRFLNPSPPTVPDPAGRLWVGTEEAEVTYLGVTVSAGANTFDQLGDPTTGRGYLTRAQREDSEVIEARRGYSDLDRLWRAMLTGYATEEELDRIGRVVNVPRPRGISDDIYRRLLQVMPYLPRCGVYAFELVLAALYPSKTPAQIRAMIWEDLVNYPCAIFLSLPETELGSVFEGKTFFNEAEAITSGSTTSLTVAHTPITVESVVLAELLQELGMAVLPSADSPAWTYVSEGDIEANVFSIVPLGLRHDISGTANGGRYTRASPGVSPDLSSIQACWTPLDLTTIVGYPWHLMLHDGEIEACLEWDGANLILGQLDGTVVAGPVAAAHNVLGTWYRFELRRDGDTVRGRFQGAEVLSAPASSFAADSTREAGFGYKNNGGSCLCAVGWSNVTLFARGSRNYWNLSRDDGSLSVGSPVLTSAAGLFAPGDTGKLVRLYGAQNENIGLWRAAYASPTQLTLSEVVRNEATVNGSGTAATVTLLDPWLRPVDVGKIITISGSLTPGNNGDVTVLEVLDAWTARVNKPGSFAAEDNLHWGFKPNFTTESSVPWELVQTGSSIGTALTLRDALPGAATDVIVTYSSVLSAQILRNEFVSNEGSGGVVPNIYYPAYFSDVADNLRRLLSDITAAGVIPYYQRLD